MRCGAGVVAVNGPEATHQAGLHGEPGEQTPGTLSWRHAAAEWYDDPAPRPARVLSYIRRMHALSVPLYGAMCAYWRARSPPSEDPLLATWEQLHRSDAVPGFSDGGLSQGGQGQAPDLADRVRTGPDGMNDAQQFALEMAMKAGVEDVERALDLATCSLDSSEVLSAAVASEDRRRRELIIELMGAGEVAQAKALATCGEWSVQLGCPEHGGGCGCEDNYVPISCDTRLCEACNKASIGEQVELYTRLEWQNPIFATLTIENVTCETPEELGRAVDAVTGAFGRLRRRTIPPEGEQGQKRWVWRADGGRPATDYWRQELARRGHQERAGRIEEDYVTATYDRGGRTVQGKQIPFGELVDGGVYAVDIKQVSGAEFNVHLHALWDGAYIPTPALSAVWEDLTGDAVVDVRRVYDRGGGSVEEALKEVVAYAAKAPEFETPGDSVKYLKALKGRRLVQTFGDLHGELPEREPSLLCSECEEMPAWWDFLGIVPEQLDTMGSVHDGESTGNDPP